jgi:hypothetical protein
MTNGDLLRRLLELTRDSWDQTGKRDSVRHSLSKVLACRTPILGGEVYASEKEAKIFYHTCKSKCCPSCGNRGTLLWQREQWAALPNIPFVGWRSQFNGVTWRRSSICARRDQSN